MKRRKLTTTLAAVLAAAMLVTGCGADTDRNPDEVTTQEHDEDIEVSEDAEIEESTENNDSYNKQNEEYTDARRKRGQLHIWQSQAFS